MSKKAEFLLSQTEWPDTECVIWPFRKDKDGYGVFASMGFNRAHRASYFLFKGDFDKKLYVLHRCDNPSCVNPNHLFLGTQLDNVRDMISKGRKVKGNVVLPDNKGERHGMSKLKESDVLEMRRLRMSGVSITDISSKFSVSLTTASDAVRGISWKHI